MIHGVFTNLDKTDGTIKASGVFQRDVLVGGNLILGTETLDPSGNAIDSSSNIMFTLNKTAHSIPLQKLSYIKNVTSDIQMQINSIATSTGIIGNVGYLTQTLSDITSTQFGTNAYNKNLLSTTSLYNSAFGGNVLYNNTSGNFNTCVGHSSGFSNTTGSCNTAVGQQALAKNTIGNYNTAVGFLSSVDNTTGSSNTSMGSYSLLHNITGSYNTAIGFFSATENTTGSSNSSFGYDTLHHNTTGTNNSAFGYHALRNNTQGYNNTSVGSASGQSMLATIGSTCVGTNADTAFSYSTAIGSNSVCTAEHQIALGTVNETVFIPGKTTMEGDMNVSDTMIVKGGSVNETTINGSISLAGDVAVSGDLSVGSGANYFTVNALSTFEYPTNFNSTTTFNQAMTFTDKLNNVTSTTFNFLKNVTSDIQQQLSNLPSSIISTIQNSPLVLYQTLNVSGLCTVTDSQVNADLTVLGNIVFNGTINSLSTFKFAHLTNVRSDIQQQFDNNTPVGSIIAYAGTAAALTGYLPCNGAYYSTTQYPKLYQAIGTIYGSSSGQFAVPNFNAVFLRGSGSQTVNGRTYNAPNMGSVASDTVGQTTSSNQFVNNVSTNSQNFLVSASGLFGINLGQAVTSVNSSKSNDNIGTGSETAPLHMSVQYFIKHL
jgi:hypothetical protein